MHVESATLRAATPEEVAQAKGNLAWRTVTYPWRLMNKTLGILQIFLHGANSLKWTTPLPLAAAHAVSRYMGWAPERLFMSDFPTLKGDFHLINKEKAVFQAVLYHHRNGGLFVHQRSFELILGFIKKAFPETEFTNEDSILTCSPENTKLYRRCIMELLRGERVQKVVQDEVEKTLPHWAKLCEGGAYMNATKQSQLFASHVITRLLFGKEYGDDALAEAVNFINYYVVAQFTKSATEEDNAKFPDALKEFSQSIHEVLDSGEGIPLFQDKELTEAQMKAMIFVIFFAGQETVAALLAYILWELGKNPEKQENLTTDKVHNVFIHGIHDFPPAHGISRLLKKDVCLEYQLEGEDETRKIIMYKGDWVGVKIIRAAESIPLPEESEENLRYSEWLPFGYGPHRCPGEKLAVKEIKEILQRLVSDYVVKTKDPEEEVEKVGLVTLKLSKDIYVNITPKTPIAATSHI